MLNKIVFSSSWRYNYPLCCQVLKYGFFGGFSYAPKVLLHFDYTLILHEWHLGGPQGCTGNGFTQGHDTIAV